MLTESSVRCWMMRRHWQFVFLSVASLFSYSLAFQRLPTSQLIKPIQRQFSTRNNIEWMESLMFWKKQNKGSDDNKPKKETVSAVEYVMESPVGEKCPCGDAVLVFGASGRLGREIVRTLLINNREVVAVGRDVTKMNNAFVEFLQNEKLFIRPGIELTNHSCITNQMFEGVGQVVFAHGPVSENSNITSEDVDYKATLHIIETLKSINDFTQSKCRSVKPLVDFNATRLNFNNWRALDDVIMGGRSSSSWTAGKDEDDMGVWQGEVVTTGGGFCGTVIRDFSFNLVGSDGVYLVVKGDGNRYKVCILLNLYVVPNSSFYFASN